MLQNLKMSKHKFQHVIATIVDEFFFRQTDDEIMFQARQLLKKKLQTNAYRVLRDPVAVEFLICFPGREAEAVVVARVDFQLVDFSHRQISL